MIRNLWSGGPVPDPAGIPVNPHAETQILQRPDADYRFLHDCMIEVFHGRIYAAWYNCPEGEMVGRSVIRGKVSGDGGRTWSPVQIMAQDPTDALIYVPPAFGVCPETDSLYLFVSRMTGPDLVHDWELFRLEESSGAWHSVRVFPEPFLPNTRMLSLANGKLIIGGRVAPAQDVYPEIPAVAISDSGRADASWRIVRIHDRIKAPDGENPFPETALLAERNKLTAFVRRDKGLPILYESFDFGETWNGPVEHNLPAGSSKQAAGMLSDGRRYLLCNPALRGRDALALFLSEPGESTFSQATLLRDGPDPVLDARPQWSYPAAVEWNGALLVVCTSEKTSCAFIRVPL